MKMGMIIAVLVSLFILFELTKMILNRNWKLISTTFGNEEYFRIIAKLKTEGIRYKTDSPNRFSTHRTERFKGITQYDIYVKKEEERKAIRALQK
jgi:protein associated with RNAse G/E